MLNETTVKFDKNREKVTSALYQYDYGQVLIIEGLDLPQAYEVHFCNEGDSATVVAIGNSEGVAIPDTLLTTGKTIRAYIFLHETATDGETEYQIRIPVIQRPEPTDIEPTPEEQSTIGQLIDAMNDAVAEASKNAEDAARSAQNVYQSELSAGLSKDAAKQSATEAKQSKTAARESAEAAATSERNASESAEAARLSKQSAFESAESAQESAASAKEDADRTEQTAQEAIQTIDEKVQAAERAKAGAQEAQTAAEQAKSGAKSAAQDVTEAKEAAEAAERNAKESKTRADQSASEASGSATAASESATTAETEALKAEGYAVGKQGGTDVETGSQYYQNNAKYYKEQATLSEGKAKEYRDSAQEIADGIETAGAAQVQAVNSAGSAQVSNVNSAGSTQVQNVNNAGTTQVQAVNTAGATQKQAVEDKGQEVLDSIPDDYSDLTQEVSDLNRALSNVEDMAYTPSIYFSHIVFTDGKRLKTNGVIEDNASYSITDYVLLKKGVSISYNLYSGNTSISNVGKYSLDKTSFTNLVSTVSGGDGTHTGTYTATEDCYIVLCGDKTRTHTANFTVSQKTVPERLDELETTAVVVSKTARDLYGEIAPDFFESGSITFSSEGFTYSASVNVIRTPQNHNVHLYSGDVIKLSDYTDLRFYPGWIISNGTTTVYQYAGTWITSGEFVAPVEGDYAIVVRHVSSTPITDIDEVAKNVVIYTNASYNGKIDANTARNIINTANVRCIAHRGYRSASPENTAPAFKLAKQKGYNWIETDVWPTSDGNYVMLHDSTVDRTSNGTGYVYDMTVEQLKALDFGSWFSPLFAGTKILTFSEFMQICKKLGLKAYIELKHGDSFTAWTQSQINDLVNIANDYGMLDKIVWIEYSSANLALVANAYPKASLAFLANDVTSILITAHDDLSSLTSGEVFISANYPQLTNNGISLAKDAHIRLEVYGAVSEQDILASNSYISGYTSENLIPAVVLYNNTING